MGTEKKAFHVPKAILCKFSKFFKGAMNPHWDAMRAQPGTIDLTDEKTNIFECYLHWHYLRTLPVIPPDEIEGGTAASAVEIGNLIGCYLLGEKLIDAAFKNAVLDGFIYSLRKRSDGNIHLAEAGMISTLYNGTRDESPVRKLFVDIYSYYQRPWVLNSAALPAEFVDGVLQNLTQDACLVTPEWEYEGGMSQYYEKTE